MITPSGFYEKINENSGCPEPMFGDAMAGFRISNIREISFSKKPEDAVFAQALNTGNPDVYIYETIEEPDRDISDCGYDFGVISEVRYRRPVIVKPYAHLRLPKRFTYRKDGVDHYESKLHNKIDKLYRYCQGEYTGEEPPYEEGMEEGMYGNLGVLDESCVTEGASPIKRAIREMLRNSRSETK